MRSKRDRDGTRSARDRFGVKKLREKLGLTQVEFAARLGVDPITVSRWERGLSKPSKLAQRQLGIVLNSDKTP